MKAKYIFERQDFKRGQDPKQSMGIGMKYKFFEYLPSSVQKLGGDLSEYQEIWKKIKEIIDKPTTQIIFERKNVSLKGRNTGKHENLFITIKLPENPMNFFFFSSIEYIIDSHSPKNLYSFEEKDNEVTYYVFKI